MDGVTVKFGKDFIQIIPENQGVAHDLSKEGLYRIRTVDEKYIIKKLK
ncbi:MAG: hypothetical protein N3D75_03860 [Candidatus Aenigmarchaeota archaeon]|nr:hypothetical protein [Candidatus Aenigmarchaeota archaeon]